MAEPEVRDDLTFSIADIIDNQLETSDKIEIGRVADIEAEWRDDGQLVLINLVTGPQALARRVSSRLLPIFRFFLRDRFEHRISVKEVESFGPTLHLRDKAADYPVGQSERWIAEHILRWIPGSGYFPIILPECEALARSALARWIGAEMQSKRTIFIGDLLGSGILTADGRHIGHVVDIQLTRGNEHKATALVYGAHGWLYRWHVLAPLAGKFGLSFEPDTIPWNAVDRFENLTITLKRGYEPEPKKQRLLPPAKKDDER
jgi:sporulation protein YlmC with PRC-barrel domain